jgi:peptidoglycan/LPS O-acetylase OafA/YrhL
LPSLDSTSSEGQASGATRASASLGAKSVGRGAHTLDYRADIDGLRAVAVLLVLAFHAAPGTLRGGFIGVDVFFVISGFLISTILFRSLQAGQFSYAEFYVRRIRRIFPALVTVLLFTALAGSWLLLPSELHQLGRHVAAGAARR